MYSFRSFRSKKETFRLQVHVLHDIYPGYIVRLNLKIAKSELDHGEDIVEYTFTDQCIVKQFKEDRMHILSLAC